MPEPAEKPLPEEIDKRMSGVPWKSVPWKSGASAPRKASRSARASAPVVELYVHSAVADSREGSELSCANSIHRPRYSQLARYQITV
ncbi:MAG: hypothetical protein WBQ08_20400 [Candidatus Sulfotelmatobacter sp.]